nr:hypothetical protein [Desulfosporosinus sp. FKB]
MSHFQDAIQSLNISLSECDIETIEEVIPENEIAGGSFPSMKFRDGVVVRESGD